MQFRVYGRPGLGGWLRLVAALTVFIAVGIAIAIVALGVFLFVLLLNTLAASPDRLRVLRSLLVIFGSAFVLKFVVLAALSDPEGGWLKRGLQALLEGLTLGTLTQTVYSPITGYVAFIALTLFFAGLALLLAGFGLYGVMAYSVAQRSREIGIRMALGAQAADVRSLVVGQAVRLGGAGLVLGLAGGLALTRVLDSLLFGVTSADPLTFTAVCAMLMTVLLVAAYLPARRATRVDPMIALRSDSSC